MLRKEPALLIGGLQVGLALLLGFGVALSPHLEAVCWALLSLVGAAVTRAHVYSPHSVRGIREDHAEALRRWVNGLPRRKGTLVGSGDA